MYFRATCGLSNLPINKDDEVVAFLLKEKSLTDLKGGHFLNIDDLYSPISAPIYARYDGYGSIKHINLKYKDLITTQVKSWFDYNVTRDVLTFKENSSSINLETASLEDLVYEFERGNVIQMANKETMSLYQDSGEFHKGYYYTGLILFHKDIFEKLVDLKFDSNSFRESYSLARNFEAVDFRRELGDENYIKLLKQVIYESRLPRSEYKNFDMYIFWYNNSSDKSMNLELLDYLRKGAVISQVMSLISKPWIPQVSSLPKEENEDILKALHSIIEYKLNHTKEDEEKVEIIEESISEMDLNIMKSIAKRFNIDITKEFNLM